MVFVSHVMLAFILVAYYSWHGMLNLESNIYVFFVIFKYHNSI
jgi:hypothetical protein